MVSTAQNSFLKNEVKTFQTPPRTFELVHSPCVHPTVIADRKD